MTLHTKILDAARYEVAREYGFADYDSFLRWCTLIETLSVFEQESSKLALDRQAEFYRWASQTGYTWHKNAFFAKIGGRQKLITELELYNIWRGKTMGEVKKLIVSYLILWTYNICPDGEFKTALSVFLKENIMKL